MSRLLDLLSTAKRDPNECDRGIDEDRLPGEGSDTGGRVRMGSHGLRGTAVGASAVLPPLLSLSVGLLSPLAMPALLVALLARRSKGLGDVGREVGAGDCRSLPKSLRKS